MTVEIAGYTFNGPYTSTDSIGDKSGVYVVASETEDEYYLIDVGESAEVKSRLDTHERKDCWKEECKGTLTYFIKYTPNLQQAGRMEIEQKIRDKFDPPCGKT